MDAHERDGRPGGLPRRGGDPGGGAEERLDQALRRHFEAEQRALLEGAPPRFGPSFAERVIAAFGRRRARAGAASRRDRSPLARAFRPALVAAAAAAAALVLGLGLAALRGPGTAEPERGPGDAARAEAPAGAVAVATAEAEPWALPEVPRFLPPSLALESPAGAGGCLEFTYLDRLVSESAAGAVPGATPAWPLGSGGTRPW